MSVGCCARKQAPGNLRTAPVCSRSEALLPAGRAAQSVGRYGRRKERYPCSGLVRPHPDTTVLVTLMATSHKYVNTETKRWSYGAELELVNWPNREPLAPGMAIDEAELHNVNSNGVAVDGRGKLYHLGGEILTAP